MIFVTFPSATMTKVDRSMPLYVLPYLFFSTQVSYRSATVCSSSESSVNGRPYLNLTCVAGLSGLTPSTTAPCAGSCPTALTASAIYFEDMQSRTYRKRDLLALLLYTPLDFVIYRPIILWARLKGSLGFLRGDKSWNKSERNVRTK
jgi:hypothetical protein